MLYFLSKLATWLLLPPGLFLMLGAAGLVLMAFRKRRAAVVFLAATFLLLLALSMRPVADALIAGLEDRYPPLTLTAPGSGSAPQGQLGYEAVVVLGGGSVDHSPEDGGHSALAPESMKRLVQGMRVAAALGLPLVFTGGRVSLRAGIETEADAARRFIAAQGHAVDALFEERSRTTRENARNVKAQYGFSSVVLVTSAYHMDRAVKSFRKEGMRVLAAPTDYKADRSGATPADFLPSMKALEISWQALHEYLGLVGYSLAR